MSTREKRIWFFNNGSGRHRDRCNCAERAGNVCVRSVESIVIRHGYAALHRDIVHDDSARQRDCRVEDLLELHQRGRIELEVRFAHVEIQPLREHPVLRARQPDLLHAAHQRVCEASLLRTQFHHLLADLRLRHISGDAQSQCQNRDYQRRYDQRFGVGKDLSQIHQGEDSRDRRREDRIHQRRAERVHISQVLAQFSRTVRFEEGRRKREHTHHRCCLYIDAEFCPDSRKDKLFDDRQHERTDHGKEHKAHYRSQKLHASVSDHLSHQNVVELGQDHADQRHHERRDNKGGDVPGIY